MRKRSVYSHGAPVPGEADQSERRGRLIDAAVENMIGFGPLAYVGHIDRRDLSPRTIMIPVCRTEVGKARFQAAMARPRSGASRYWTAQWAANQPAKPAISTRKTRGPWAAAATGDDRCHDADALDLEKLRQGLLRALSRLFPSQASPARCITTHQSADLQLDPEPPLPIGPLKYDIGLGRVAEQFREGPIEDRSLVPACPALRAALDETLLKVPGQRPHNVRPPDPKPFCRPRVERKAPSVAHATRRLR
jgi:hypothetical protein